MYRDPNHNQPTPPHARSVYSNDLLPLRSHKMLDKSCAMDKIILLFGGEFKKISLYFCDRAEKSFDSNSFKGSLAEIKERNRLRTMALGKISAISPGSAAQLQDALVCKGKRTQQSVKR